MIFWIFVIVMAAAIVCCAILDDCEFFVSIAALNGTIAIIMLVFIIVGGVGPDAKIAKYQARYDSLVYQYENDIYDNENDLGKRDLMEDIEEWNTDLAYHKRIQRNFWVGIFYPNIYDYFDFIELQ